MQDSISWGSDVVDGVGRLSQAPNLGNPVSATLPDGPCSKDENTQGHVIPLIMNQTRIDGNIINESFGEIRVDGVLREAVAICPFCTHLSQEIPFPLSITCRIEIVITVSCIYHPHIHISSPSPLLSLHLYKRPLKTQIQSSNPKPNIQHHTQK